MAGRRVRFALPPGGHELPGAEASSSQKKGEVNKHLDSQAFFSSSLPEPPPSLITPPFMINMLREAGALDELEPPAPPPSQLLPYSTVAVRERAVAQKEQLRRANQFAMPTDPINPETLKDLVPLDQVAAFEQAVHKRMVNSTIRVNLHAPRGGSASVRVSKKRTRAAADDDDNDDDDEGQAPPSKAARGGPRTRYHPVPGRSGISRGQAHKELKSGSTILHRDALRTSSPDARITSQAAHFAPEPSSCHECPAYWTSGPGIDPLSQVLDGDDDVVHSAPVVACSQTKAHGDVPYYVCASCRIRAEKHKAKHFDDLANHDRSLPICDVCATDRVTIVANPEHVENGRMKICGCTCRKDWICFECTLSDMQTAKLTYDAEVEARRGFAGPPEVSRDGKLTTVWIKTNCICGESLRGNEIGWRCTCCRGIGYL
ncbi:MAG: hypothetical protein Q9207_000389 [Kuettlingeria erythrocarpa]